MDRSKEAVVQRVAEAHYELEPGMQRIVRLEGTSQEETDPKEPVKLLEVNEDTVPAGIRPLFFGAHPASGVFYPIVIIELTPAEFEEVRRDPSRLPNRWRLGREIPRPSSAEAV